nr:hypothetical protein [Marinobacter sp. ELB17]
MTSTLFLDHGLKRQRVKNIHACLLHRFNSHAHGGDIGLHVTRTAPIEYLAMVPTEV